MLGDYHWCPEHNVRLLAFLVNKPNQLINNLGAWDDFLYLPTPVQLLTTCPQMKLHTYFSGSQTRKINTFINMFSTNLHLHQNFQCMFGSNGRLHQTFWHMFGTNRSKLCVTQCVGDLYTDVE